MKFKTIVTLLKKEKINGQETTSESILEFDEIVTAETLKILSERYDEVKAVTTSVVEKNPPKPDAKKIIDEAMREHFKIGAGYYPEVIFVGPKLYSELNAIANHVKASHQSSTILQYNMINIYEVPKLEDWAIKLLSRSNSC